MGDKKTNGHATDEVGDEFFRADIKPTTPIEDLDLDEYRAGQSLDLANIVTLPTNQKVEIRRPRAKEWFRTYSAESLERLWLFEGDGINDFYLVRSDVAANLPDEFMEVYLILCVNSSGRMFLWPIKCNSQGGQEFTESALAHASQARSSWLRRKWIPRIKTHRPDVSELEGIEPEWPDDLSVRSVITRAFGDRVIKSLDHPCLKFARR